MTAPVRIGISTCPNDTFAFHGLMKGHVDQRGLDFTFELLDIQELNDRLFAGDFDVAKTSFHAALKLVDETLVLPSGSALGFGVGPLLLAAQPSTKPTDRSQVTLCPGADTTATLLMKLFYPDSTRLQQCVFSEIMPALQRGEADFGVCIHEGRFTWQSEGLSLIEDLGTRWERETECPLPLGGLVARRSLGAEKMAAVQACVFDSIRYGMTHRDDTASTMRRYAQEFSDDVLFQHVDLYVNDWTVDLGDVGQQALETMSKRAVDLNMIAPNSPGLQVFAPV